MKKLKWHTTVVILGLLFGDAGAQNIELENGYLTWSNVNPNLYYTVEYSPSIEAIEGWDGSYVQLRDIHTSQKTITVPVGVYYRVIMSDVPLHTKELSPGSSMMAAGYYTATALSAIDGNLASGNIRSGVSIFGVGGKPEVVDTTSGNAQAGDLLLGKKAWVGGSEVTGTVPTRTLSSTTTLVQAGFYPATNLTLVDADLIADNIKKDVSIFGVLGTFDPPQLEERYKDNGNGTVTDQATGLMWPKNAYHGDKMTWQSATSFVARLNSTNYLGYDSWRLPSVLKEGAAAELDTIGRFAGDPTKAFTKPTTPFQNVQSGDYWSRITSTLFPGGDWAWGVNLGVGYSFIAQKSSLGYVWPVRQFVAQPQ